MKKMNKMYLVLGDWSSDGHGKSEKVLVNVNKTVKEVQDAYKASCKLTGISFNHNEDFTGIKRDYTNQAAYHVLTEYQDSELSDEVIEVFKKYKIDYKSESDDEDDDNEIYDDPKLWFATLWFNFVKISLPDLKFDFPTELDDIPVINGYWNKNLNVQFGYGLYE